MLSCHALHLFRSCRSSRLQRFTPRIALQVYCTLQPIMGFAMFQNPGFACRCPNNSDPKAPHVSYRLNFHSRKSVILTASITQCPKTPPTEQHCQFQFVRKLTFTQSAPLVSLPRKEVNPGPATYAFATHSLWRSTLRSFSLNISRTPSPRSPEFTKGLYLLAVFLPAISQSTFLRRGSQTV